jgi:hypothetical protein
MDEFESSKGYHQARPHRAHDFVQTSQWLKYKHHPCTLDTSCVLASPELYISDSPALYRTKPTGLRACVRGFGDDDNRIIWAVEDIFTDCIAQFFLILSTSKYEMKDWQQA